MKTSHASFRPTRRRWHHVAGSCLVQVLLMGRASGGHAADGGQPDASASGAREQKRMWMTVGGTRRFAVALEDNPTARAFVQLCPLSLEMPDLNDNEKHARLPASLPTDATRPGTIRTGDLMLYGHDTLVVFYKTFASSYAYTRIGRVTPLDGLVEALGPGSQRIAFAWE